MNNDKAQEFVITVWREESNEVEKKSNQVEGKSNQVGNQVEQKSNEVEEKSNQVQDSDIRLRHSDTDLATDHDTFVEDHDTIHSYHDTNHDTKRVPLTNKQKDIVNFCSVPRTSREILERAGVVYHTKNIAKYITSLVAAGYLQMTNPDNPTASNQKYIYKMHGFLFHLPCIRCYYKSLSSEFSHFQNNKYYHYNLTTLEQSPHIQYPTTYYNIFHPPQNHKPRHLSQKA